MVVIKVYCFNTASWWIVCDWDWCPQNREVILKILVFNNLVVAGRVVTSEIKISLTTWTRIWLKLLKLVTFDGGVILVPVSFNIRGWFLVLITQFRYEHIYEPLMVVSVIVDAVECNNAYITIFRLKCCRKGTCLSQCQFFSSFS